MKCPKCQADNADEAVCCSLCYETFKPKTKSASSEDGGSSGEAQPSDAQGWYRRAARHAELDEFDEALACHSRVVDLDPGHADSWLCKGMLLCGKADRQEEGLACMRRAQELGHPDAAGWIERVDKPVEPPTEAERCYQRGNALMLEMDDDEGEDSLVAEKSSQALASLDKALALEPRHVEAWFCKGRVLADHSSRPEESLPCFAQALALNPRHAAAWLFRGMVLAKVQCDWKAFLCFESARQLGHPQAESLMELHRQVATAVGSLTPDGGSQAPSDSDGWFQLGSRFQETKQPQEALRCYERCVMIDSRHAAGWIGIGMLIFRPERSAEAFECFELARLIGHPEAADIADRYRKMIEAPAPGRAS